MLPAADPVSQTLEWRLELPAAAARSAAPGQQVQVRFSGATERAPGRAAGGRVAPR